VTDTGSTSTEFSATVARDAMNMHRRMPTRTALAVGGAVVTAVIALGGAWRSLAGPRGRETTAATTGPASPSASAVTLASAVSRELPAVDEAPTPSGSWSAPAVSTTPPVRAVEHTADERRPSTTAPAARTKPVPDATPPHAAHAVPRPTADRNDVF
jgi:hypothetical protein